QGQGFCDSTALSGLNNQVIEIGIPDIAELTGIVNPTLGGQPGTQIQIGALIENLGLQPTGSGFDVAFYLSDDSQITTADTLLARVTVPALDAQTNYAVSATIAVPNLMQGYYSLGAIVDVDGVVTEATEANNAIVSANPFLVGADLYTTFDVSPLPLPP